MELTHRAAELVERDAWLDLFEAAPNRVREELGISSSLVAGMGLLGCRAIPITEMNRAMAVGVECPPSRADMDGAVNWLDTHATSWALQVAPALELASVDDCLDELNMVETGMGWAKFVGTNVLPPSRPSDGSVQIEVVTDEKAAAFGTTVTEGFGLPAVCRDWFAELPRRPSWKCFVAAVDGKVAGGGAMFVQADTAWLGIEATLTPFRRRGAQRTIIAEQLRTAIAAGTTVLTCETAVPVNPNDVGFSSYRNQQWAGLTHTYTRSNFKRTS